jgi:hypothetical protein
LDERWEDYPPDRAADVLELAPEDYEIDEERWRYYSGGSRPGCLRQPGMYCELPPGVNLLFIYLPNVDRARVP